MTRIAFFDTKPYDREFFEAATNRSGLELCFLDHRLSEATTVTAHGADAVCCFVNDRLDRAVLTQLRNANVRHVAMRCAGFNNIDLPAAKELGLTVTRVPAYSPHAVAEHTIALLQTLNRRIHRAHNRVREHNFSLAGLVGFDLHGRTAGIIGTGKIGRITAEILRGFGMRVLAFDPFPSTAWAAENRVTYVELRELFRESHVVSLHVPLTHDTHHFINADSLAQMRRDVYLVNTSRGKLVDTGALIAALKTSHVGGVALDVYEEEEGVFFEDLSGDVLADDELARLITFPNVLITSHQAFLTREALAEIARVTTENLHCLAHGCAFLDGTQLA
ncbi:MAG: 2-hydroxyacid dehydrogenase [Candidatus Didemnitutus sp.]|nr:2-hydroxyacid dehydrogenase [Candidatus Didemnitutus sp.]